MLSMSRYKNLFNAIASGTQRKMPCADVRAARQFLAVGLVRLTGKRDDVTTSWTLTELGEKHVN